MPGRCHRVQAALIALALGAWGSPALASDESPPADAGSTTYDPSDPTRVDTRGGFGVKNTEYDPSGQLRELRAKIAVQLNPKDLVTIDIGVGKNLNVPGESDEFGLTDVRFRFFRMWNVDRSIVAGWQGWGTSLELQTPGNVPGTDGSGLVALGAMGALGLGSGFSAFLNPIVSTVWTRGFDQHLGIAARFDLFLTYKPGTLWTGAYFKLKPSVSYGLSDEIQDQGAANLEASVGGAFSRVLWWDIQARTFLEKELDRETEGRESGVADDWSLYLSLTYFF